MTRARFAPLLLLAALLGSVGAAARLASSATIVVRLYDLAGAPPVEIARATSEASEIFERIGVRLVWLDCGVGTAEPRCNEVSGPAVLNLRLMPPHMQPRDGLPKGIFGFALMSADGGFARTANVYFERVSEISDGRKLRRPVVLGAMMAHEFGHLLLGIHSHSKMGLMRLPWGPKVLLDADRGMLGFSKGEADRVRQAAQERVRANAWLARSGL